MTPFDFHTGLESLEKVKPDGQKIFETDCFCCGKEGHLHYFEDSRWGCKVCGKTGNKYDFIKLIYEEALVDVSPVAKNRQLPERALAGIRFNRRNNSFIVPTFKAGKLNNLYKLSHEFRCLSTPTVSGTMLDWPENPEQEMWICEGQWNRYAGIAINPSGDKRTYVGIPGATSFKESWTGAFRDKDVVLVFDHDDAGEQGVKKVLKAFEDSPQKPRSIRRLHWPANSKKGYDLRDYYIEFGRTAKGWKTLNSYITEVENKEATKLTVHNVIEDFTCDSYDKALASFETAFHTTPDMRMALAATMAAIYSVTMDTPDQVWLKIIGPPSCGKSSIAKAVSGSDHVQALSTFTGLFSGHSDADESDAGMVPMIANRTLIIKDADPLLRQPNIEQIMSELRDFYDKSSSVKYRNRRHYDYRNVRSSVILCGTQVLRRADQAFLGERFLCVEMDVNDADSRAICKRVIKKGFEAAINKVKDPEDGIMSCMKGWINHLRDRKLDSNLPDEYMDELMELCFFAALMRTIVDRDFKGKLLSPAVAEVPARLISQNQKLSLALSAVYGENTPTEEIYKVVKKLIKDTVNPRSTRYLICDTILENPGIDIFELMDATELPKTTINEELNDLDELGLIKIDRIASDRPGRQRRGFILDDKIAIPLRGL